MKNGKPVTFVCVAGNRLTEKVRFVRHVKTVRQHMVESFIKNYRQLVSALDVVRICCMVMKKSCIECRAKSAEAASKKRAADVKKYNERQKVWRKARYEKDKENGICTRCRKRKADPGYSTCTFCRETMRRARVKKPERTGRYEQGLCFFCDNPVKPGYKVCEMHYQKNVKNATCEKANIARQKMKERSPQWTP